MQAQTDTLHVSKVASHAGLTSEHPALASKFSETLISINPSESAKGLRKIRNHHRLDRRNKKRARTLISCPPNEVEINLYLLTDSFSPAENEMFLLDFDDMLAGNFSSAIWIYELGDFDSNMEYELSACINMNNCWSFFFLGKSVGSV
jgi:hypothetical protein